MTTEQTDTQQKTLEERKALLAREVAASVGRGLRIESQSDTMAIVVSGKPVNHILHLIISVLTLGIWLIPWAIMAIAGGERRRMITVDEYGNVLTQKAGV